MSDILTEVKEKIVISQIKELIDRVKLATLGNPETLIVCALANIITEINIKNGNSKKIWLRQMSDIWDYYDDHSE